VSLHAHNQADGQLKTHIRKKELNNKNIIAGIGSGYVQAQGHEL
jgi:hypothetical protein